MTRLKNPNLDILIRTVERLGDLSKEMVFLGGCATGLLITDTAAPPIRMTKDVDAIVHVTSLIVDELGNVDKKLKAEIAQRFKALLNDPRFIDAISGHMPTDSAGQQRVGRINRIIEKISKN